MSDLVFKSYDNKNEENKKYICIHGHFYQPYRKNPWIDEIEVQEEAFPYHDWNERINAECYSANCFAHILNWQNKLENVVNNFSKISFNVGPTLFEWLKENDFETFQEIIKADEESKKIFSGHGSAIAQTYNHLIMPLAEKEDKIVQTYWAIKDFESKFKRKTEGMWLAETAVDYETLEVLAELDIKFTILSPNQALKFKKVNCISRNNQNWTNAINGDINTRMPYLCKLPSGKSIVIFFYDRALSIGVSFGDLLTNGEKFAESLINAPSYNQKQPEIVIVASDGETYGHHKKFGDMALAYCLNVLEKSEKVKLTVFGEYLEMFPPNYEVQIIEKSSWSCPHSLNRWKSNCGCAIGNGVHKEWNQDWRAPLREAIDLLRLKLNEIYYKEINNFIDEEKIKPIDVLKSYINIINDRSISNIAEFLDVNNCINTSSVGNDGCRLLELLEMQRQAMLMQSSDGWFFDDIYRFESIQILKHACRAIELAGKDYSYELENMFIEILKDARSNLDDKINGAYIYNNIVKKSVYDFKNIAAQLMTILLINNKNNNKDMKENFSNTSDSLKTNNSYQFTKDNDFTKKTGDNTIVYYNYITKLLYLNKFDNSSVEVFSGIGKSVSLINSSKHVFGFIEIINKNHFAKAVDDLKKHILAIYVKELSNNDNNDLNTNNFSDLVNSIKNFSESFKKSLNDNLEPNFLDGLSNYFDKSKEGLLITLDDFSKKNQLKVLNNMADYKLNQLKFYIEDNGKLINNLSCYSKPWNSYDFVFDDLKEMDYYIIKVLIYNLVKKDKLTHKEIEDLLSLITKFENHGFTRVSSSKNLVFRTLDFSNLDLKVESSLFYLLNSLLANIKDSCYLDTEIEFVLRDINHLLFIFNKLKININKWKVQNKLFVIQRKITELKKQSKIILSSDFINSLNFLINSFDLVNNLNS